MEKIERRTNFPIITKRKDFTIKG